MTDSPERIWRAVNAHGEAVYLSHRPTTWRSDEYVRADLLAAKDAEIERLRTDCVELYQVIGYLATKAGLFNDPQTVKAMDNACAAHAGEPRPHADLLPFTASMKDAVP